MNNELIYFIIAAIIISIIWVTINVFRLPKNDEINTEGMYINLTSSAGHDIVIPNTWEVDDQGNNLSIYTDDGQASYNIYTALKEGSGDLENFKKMFSKEFKDGNLLSESWSPVTINNCTGFYIQYNVENKQESWDIYILESNEYYLAITLKSSIVARQLNEEFYINVIKTFKSKR